MIVLYQMFAKLIVLLTNNPLKCTVEMKIDTLLLYNTHALTCIKHTIGYTQTVFHRGH